MPSAAARELEATVSRVIADAGATIVEKKTTGSGHNKVVFERGGEQRMYYFAKTPSDGRGKKNAVADLKKLLKELPAPRSKPKPKPRTVVGTLEAPREETPKNPQKLTPARRKQIAKAYLSCASVEELCEKEGLELYQAEPILLGQKGQASEKLRRELDSKALRLKRKLRQPETEPEVIAKRDRRIYVYTYYGLSIGEAARLFDLSAEQVRQIIQQEEDRPNRVRALVCEEAGDVG